jgi:hypothetical protein
VLGVVMGLVELLLAGSPPRSIGYLGGMWRMLRRAQHGHYRTRSLVYYVSRNCWKVRAAESDSGHVRRRQGSRHRGGRNHAQGTTHKEPRTRNHARPGLGSRHQPKEKKSSTEQPTGHQECLIAVSPTPQKIRHDPVVPRQFTQPRASLNSRQRLFIVLGSSVDRLSDAGQKSS